MLDIDAIEHALGRWHADPSMAGPQARRLSLRLATELLDSGFDVVVGQSLARTSFIESLERPAEEAGAPFHVYASELTAGTLAHRLAARAEHPDRPEHRVDNRLVGPDDALALVRSLEPVRSSRGRGYHHPAGRGLRPRAGSLLPFAGC